jgi:uncharacterized OB-fold protein
MPYLPDGTPLPRPTPDDRPYWEAIDRRELRIQCCAACNSFRHPPTPLCPDCGSDRIAWRQVPGTGEVFSWTIATHATHPALKAAVPYNIAVVALDGAGDVRIVSNVIDARPEEMRIGLRLRLVWEPTAAGGYLPRFAKLT